jgi:CRP-like cAMP-binding protein
VGSVSINCHEPEEEQEGSVNLGDLGRQYGDGEVIIREGDVGECMYVVQEGEVEVYVERDGEDVRLVARGKGSMIGEMAVFEREVRSASVRARGRARLLTIDKKNFMKRINEDPTLAFRIVEAMSGRIRELSAEVVRLRSDARTE